MGLATNVFKATRSFLVDIGEAESDLIKTHVLPAEQPKEKEEKDKNPAKGSINFATYNYEAQVRADLDRLKQEAQVKEEMRLDVAGMTSEMINKYLGKNRNLSFRGVRGYAYYLHEVVRAISDMQRQEEKKKKASEVATVMPGGIPGGIRLDTIGEGGNIMSTTGGGGVG